MASGLLSTRFSLPPPQTFLFQLFISSATVGLTKPTSLIRPVVLPFVTACVYHIVSTVHLHARSRWASIFGATSFAFLLQYIDLAFLSRWNYVDHGTTSVTAKEPSHENRSVSGERPDDFPTIWKRFSFGWSSMWAFRHLNTKNETKNVLTFSTDDPEYIPTRWHFILKRTLMAVACYVVLDLAGARPPPKNKGSLFNPAIVPVFRRLGSITYGELKLRILSTTSFWVTLYSLLQGGQAAASAIAIGFGLSNVIDWRPAFGSLSDAYTLRNFWGKFWHQSLRRMLTEPANFITSDMLKLPKGSLLARYLNIFLIFGLSGVLHSIAGISSKMPLTEYGVLRFFCTQTLGIIIEDGFQALFNRFGGMNSTGRPTSTLTRCVGYSWVYVFLIWTTPSWLYPQASRPTVPGSRDILPYSILRALRS